MIFRRTVAVSILFIGTVLTAQVARNHEVALKNWPAPLYWQPTQAETAVAGLKPEVQPAQAQSQNGGLVFVGMTPCRVVDTRAAQGFPPDFGAPSLVANADRTFPIRASATCSIPGSAQAYSFNVTVVPPGPLGYLTIWPTGQSQPNAVTLDDILGDIRNNAAIVPAGATPTGSVNVHVNASTELVIDINGYYVSPNAVSNPGFNTAYGTQSLAVNTTGSSNTAIGNAALASNTTGSSNTASGAGALIANTTGNFNTATGGNALSSNTTGGNNTATGTNALNNNTSGSSNTALGMYALSANTAGENNVASGFGALYVNTTGGSNTATGSNALSGNLTGNNNTASGSGALLNSVIGNSNVALGFNAGSKITIGSGNINIGANAGLNVVAGSYNIEIGNMGVASDSGVIRIGTSGTHTSFFAAGIQGVVTGNNNAVTVMIDSNGQLGTINSSRRFKEDIQDMADASNGLLRLRPVTYRYRQPYADGSQPIDYGLIAEEVAEVYPDLVVRSDDGQIQTVQYHKLTPMLLNELRKEHQTIELQGLAFQQHDETVQALQARLLALQKALDALVAGSVQ